LAGPGIFPFWDADNFVAKVCRLDERSTEDITDVLGQLAGHMIQGKELNDFEKWRRQI
jgi:hypothetical protein